DGKEVTGGDVKFSFDLAQASPTAKAKVANVVDVKVVDRHTVEVKTSGPAASLLANLAWVFILPKADFQAKGAEAFGQKPIGSGPYRLERLGKRTRVGLTAVGGQWGGQRKPHTNVMPPVTTGSTRLAELLTGGVEVITDRPVENVQQVRDNKDLTVVQAKGIRQIFFPINAKADTPLKDKRVRQAINLAIDRETIVRDVLQGFA